MTNEDLLVQVKLFADRLNIEHSQIRAGVVSIGLTRDKYAGWYVSFSLVDSNSCVLTRLFVKDDDEIICVAIGRAATVEASYADAVNKSTRRYPKPWVD